MKRVMAFALAGGRTRGLSVLSQPRSVAAVPFAGKFRLIDFTLSNCVNSEISHVAVLAQYAPLSLAQHLGRGEPWDLNRREGGVHILQPYARQEGARWYEGTADALRQNLDVLENSGAEWVFVLSSDLVYKMDYSWMLEEHLESGARVTLGVGRVPYGESGRFGMVRVDEEGRILGFQEKPESTEFSQAFMGVYLFDGAFLKRILLENDGPNLILDVLRPYLEDPAMVRAYTFGGYWEDVGSVPHYFRAHQRLLGDDPAPNLYDPGWRIYTRSEEMSPVLFHAGSKVTDSFLSNGAVIAGRVERSVISPGVYVGPGAAVRDAVILNGTTVGAGATVERAVVDKNVVIGNGARVGRGDADAGSGDPELMGITLVGKWAQIGERAEIGAGVVIPPGEPISDAAYHARMGEARR
jgi:glucose-1-phosphate adenylyltransferase